MATVNVQRFLANEKLPLVERRYDKDGMRWYYLPKDRDNLALHFPSVTDIIKEMKAPRKTWRDNVGTRLHDIVEDDLRGTVYTGSEYAGTYKAWLQLKQEHGIVAEVMELPIVSVKHGYGGTLDFKGLYDGNRVIMDLKTGGYSKKAGWQLGAYRQGYEEMTGESVGMVGLKVTRYDSKPEGFVYNHYSWCFDTFLAAFKIWKANHFRELERIGWKWLHV